MTTPAPTPAGRGADRRIEADGRGVAAAERAYAEQVADLGEIRMNYATTGDGDRPALLLIGGQTESWWGYEPAMPLLGAHFEVFAVDLRGQGRSTWTPGRYTLDTMGHDLATFVDAVIGRPTVVSGNSSGGVLAAWLAAYARPGQIRGAVLEDPPLFASELVTSFGHPIGQALGPLFAHFNKWLGDQWSIGDWEGMQAAFGSEVPLEILDALQAMAGGEGGPPPAGPPQNMREYDPEWGRAFVTGTAAAGCDHASMLAAARVPMLLTQHYWAIDAGTQRLLGAISPAQVERASELVSGEAGQPFDVREFPGMAHAMHAHDPELFTRTILEWTSTLTP